MFLLLIELVPDPSEITQLIRKIFKHNFSGQTIIIFCCKLSHLNTSICFLIFLRCFAQAKLLKVSCSFLDRPIHSTLHEMDVFEKFKKKTSNILVSPRRYLSGLATFLWACADQYPLGVFRILLWLYVERICPRRTLGTELLYSEHPLDRSQRETSPWKLDQLFLSEPRKFGKDIMVLFYQFKIESSHFGIKLFLDKRFSWVISSFTGF